MTHAKDEAMKLALEAFDSMVGRKPERVEQAITALRKALDEKSTQQGPVAWKHDCAALLQNDVELWVDRCPHCGKPRATPSAAPEKSHP